MDATFETAWQAGQEMGIATIGLPESAGGGGGSVLDVAVALEACAYELVPGPLLGPAVASLVLPEMSADAIVGIGLSDVVSDLPSATHVLLADAEGSWSVYPRDAVEASSSVGLDLSRRFGTARVVDESAGVAVPGLTTDLLRRTTITLAAAEAAGVARWCLATAVEYAKVREQFGQKIGAFQAIKHLCAEMLETAEAVTAAAWDVACVAGEDGEQWAFAADVAAAIVFDGAVDVAKSCIQVLGGIGFTFEHDAHLYLRRAIALRALVGDSDAAAERLTAAAIDGIRRRVHLDLDGRDEPIRDEIRGTVERIAALPSEERRAAFVETGYLTPHWPAPDGLGADAVDPGRHRPGARACRADPPRHRDRRLGGADDPRARHRGAARAVRAPVAAGRADLVPALLRARAPAPTSRRCGPVPPRWTAGGSCPGRRSGTRSPSAPTGASASLAPTRTCRSTRASPTSWST